MVDTRVIELIESKVSVLTANSVNIVMTTGFKH